MWKLTILIVVEVVMVVVNLLELMCCGNKVKWRLYVSLESEVKADV